jgi:uncharacterized protein YutE (UPF0331/DUF86 family)
VATAVFERKLAKLKQFVGDFKAFLPLDRSGRERQHYAIERLLQLLCEASADIALQVIKGKQLLPPDTYRQIFGTLAQAGLLEPTLAEDLAKACGMRNILTHAYVDIDMNLVVNSIEPAVSVYEQFLAWAVQQSL